MFGLEEELRNLVLTLGLGMALLSAVITWAAARRYGRKRALVVPILALVAVGALVFRAHGTVADEAMRMTAFAMLFAGPAVAGGLLGLILSGRRKG